MKSKMYLAVGPNAFKVISEYEGRLSFWPALTSFTAAYDWTTPLIKRMIGERR